MTRNKKKRTASPSNSDEEVWGEPDDIEAEIIRIVSAIPEQARTENWPTDDRMRITRLIAKWRVSVLLSDTRNNRVALEDEVVTDRWTETIFGRLDQLGRPFGYTTSRRQRPRPHPWERMWDLTWLKYGGQPRRLISLPLILESALDRYADLEKLLTARAEHRIVIFQGKVPFRDNRYFEQFATQVRECGMTQPGDRYLFLCFDRNDRKFKFRVFVARADLLLYSQ